MSVRIKGIFPHLDTLVEAIWRLKQAGHRRFVVTAPLPRHEILEQVYEGRPSPVRWWTMTGGMLGGTFGFTLASLAALDWPMAIPGGKPLVAILPYIVITFECTVLFGALATLLGMIFHARLPAATIEHELTDPRLSDDVFCLLVHDVAPAEVEKVRALLRSAGASEVTGGDQDRKEVAHA